LIRFGTVTHIGLLQWIDRKNFEFLKIQNGGGRHLGKSQNRDVSVMV